MRPLGRLGCAISKLKPKQIKEKGGSQGKKTRIVLVLKEAKPVILKAQQRAQSIGSLVRTIRG